MSHRTGVKFDEQELASSIISAQVRAINASPRLDATQKVALIAELKLTHREMADIINKVRTRPVDTDNVHTKDESVPLADSIKSVISPDRPSDVPRPSKSKTK